MRPWSLLLRAALVAGGVFAIDVALSPHRVAGQLQALVTAPPSRTSFMLHAQSEGERVQVGRFVSMDEIPPVLACAVVMGEHTKFFRQGALDPASQRRLMRRMLKGDFSQGASGLSQQLARNLFLSKDRTIRRKLREYAIAFEIDRTLSKTRQLELYLNVVEWGRGVWGLDAASHHYFGVAPADLTPTQSILLATILPAPRQSRRFLNTKAAGQRMNKMVNGVWRSRLLSDAQRGVVETRLALWKRPGARDASMRDTWDRTERLMGPEARHSDVARPGPAVPIPLLCNPARRHEWLMRAGSTAHQAG